MGGSIANLLYPYFIQQKGWKGPKYRRLQLYDLAFGTLAVVLLNMAVWTVGAEVLRPARITVKELDDLTQLLTKVLGDLGGPIFYLGAFAALFSTIVGNATGYGYMLADIARQQGKSPQSVETEPKLSDSWVYPAVAGWSLFSPLVWCLPGMPGFVAMTIVVNSATVIILPVLAAGLWYITARADCIGFEYKNTWWENGLMGILFFLACWGGWQSLQQVLLQVGFPIGGSLP